MSISTLYINKIADSILFDEKNKEFTICDGSLGTYKFCDVVRSQIVYEHAKYKGKSPLFSHKVLISTFNTSIFIELKKVYVGIEIELSNKEKVYVYISKKLIKKAPILDNIYYYPDRCSHQLELFNHFIDQRF